MKHTRQIILLAFTALRACCNVSAQQPMKQWQDTPTPDEITVHNQPYIILQNEIEKNLFNNDWDFSTNDSRGKSATPFLILKGDPSEDVILRGTTVHYFSPVDRGNVAEVQMKPNSPLYIANFILSIVLQIRPTNRAFRVPVYHSTQQAPMNFGTLI